MLDWKFQEKKHLIDYLKEIPEDATLRDMFMVAGKVTDHYLPYEFVLEKVVSSSNSIKFSSC